MKQPTRRQSVAIVLVMILLIPSVVGIAMAAAGDVLWSRDELNSHQDIAVAGDHGFVFRNDDAEHEFEVIHASNGTLRSTHGFMAGDQPVLEYLFYDRNNSILYTAEEESGGGGGVQSFDVSNSGISKRWEYVSGRDVISVAATDDFVYAADRLGRMEKIHASNGTLADSWSIGGLTDSYHVGAVGDSVFVANATELTIYDPSGTEKSNQMLISGNGRETDPIDYEGNTIWLVAGRLYQFDVDGNELVNRSLAGGSGETSLGVGDGFVATVNGTHVLLYNTADASLDLTFTQAGTQSDRYVSVAANESDNIVVYAGAVNFGSNDFDTRAYETGEFGPVGENEDLTLKVEPWMRHGSTQEYVVQFEDDFVTEAANVTSGNTDVITVNNDTKRLIATSNTSLNERVVMTVTYKGLTATRNVTVALQTAGNVDIMPDAITRLTALLGNAPGPDGERPGGTQMTIQIIVIATMAGVAATWAAGSFAGIGMITVVMTAGWFMGWVGDGMVLVTLFVGLFIGLNVARNWQPRNPLN